MLNLAIDPQKHFNLGLYIIQNQQQVLSYYRLPNDNNHNKLMINCLLLNRTGWLIILVGVQLRTVIGPNSRIVI